MLIKYLIDREQTWCDLLVVDMLKAPECWIFSVKAKIFRCNCIFRRLKISDVIAENAELRSGRIFLYLPMKSGLYLEGYKYLFCRYKVSNSVLNIQCKRTKYLALFFLVSCMCLLNIQLFLIIFLQSLSGLYFFQLDLPYKRLVWISVLTFCAFPCFCVICTSLCLFLMYRCWF